MANTAVQISEASLANLKPWQPGQSGNPGGRPKSRNITKALRIAVEKEYGDGRTGAEIIATKLMELVEEGNVHAIRELNDRLEGKPLQANLNVTIDQSVQSLGDEEFEEFVARERERRAAVPRIQVEQIPGSAPRPATIALRAPSDSK